MKSKNRLYRASVSYGYVPTKSRGRALINAENCRAVGHSTVTGNVLRQSIGMGVDWSDGYVLLDG